MAKQKKDQEVNNDTLVAELEAQLGGEDQNNNDDQTPETIVDKYVSGDMDGFKDLVHKHVVKTVSALVNGTQATKD